MNDEQESKDVAEQVAVTESPDTSGVLETTDVASQEGDKKKGKKKKDKKAKKEKKSKKGKKGKKGKK
jgi:hypothetical protein